MKAQTQKATETSPGSPDLARARPYDEADRAGMLRVYRTVFGEAAARMLESRWAWSQVDNPCSAESRKWTLESDAGIVGFLAAVPQRYAINGQPVVAHTPCEFMVEPGSRFHGVKLMRSFVAECAHCVTFDDVEATIAINKWLKIQSIAYFRRYVFPLTPLGAARYVGRAVIRDRQAPSPRSLIPWLLGRLPKPPATRYRFTELREFDGRFDALANGLAAGIPALVYRDQAYLQWRYRQHSPHRESTIIAARGPDGMLVGYSVSQAEDNSARSGVVLDFAVLPAHGAAVHGLLGATARSLRARQAASMQVYCAGAAGDALEQTLTRLGFHRFSTPLQVMVRFRDPSLQEIACTPEAWYLQLGDTEYSHHAIAATKESS